MTYAYHKAFDCFSKELDNGNSIVVRLERTENVIHIHPRTVYLPCSGEARDSALELMTHPTTTSAIDTLLNTLQRIGADYAKAAAYREEYVEDEEG